MKTQLILPVTESGELDRVSHLAWVRNFCSALEPYHAGDYVNFLMEGGEERIRQAYGAKKHGRLEELKRRYDPDDPFRLNQNDRPG